MGKRFDAIGPEHRSFIEAQKMFFVATAAPDGRVNMSPKGHDTLRVIDENRVVWLNLTGSGNETAAHLRESPRITLMFCAFEGPPNILRLYGQARALHPRDDAWAQWAGLFPDYTGARQIIDVRVELVQSSCGFAVPLYEYVGDRDTLSRWAEKKGRQGVEDYWTDRNRLSLDGKPTNILGDALPLQRRG